MLRVLDSSPLTAWQARLMVGRQLQNVTGTPLVLRLKGRLLLGLSASTVVNTPVSHLPQRLLTHLLTHLPTSSPALFPLYLKTWGILSKYCKTFDLKNIFINTL